MTGTRGVGRVLVVAALAIACAVALAAAWRNRAEQLPACGDLARAIQDLLRADTRARDFPELARYRDENRDLQAGRARVVFLGDSITDFWSQPQFGGFFPSRPYANRGIAGQTTPQLLLRMRQDVIALRPQVVVVLAGTNDIAGNTGPMTDEQIEGNLESICQLAVANRITPMLSSILPVSDYHRRPGAMPMTTRRPPARILAINDWMRGYAGQHQLIYVDYHSAMVDERGMLRAELSEDDLHPNAVGYAVMAPLADAAVQKARGGQR